MKKNYFNIFEVFIKLFQKSYLNLKDGLTWKCILPEHFEMVH